MPDCRLRRLARSLIVYNYRWTNNKLKATPNPNPKPKPIPNLTLTKKSKNLQKLGWKKILKNWQKYGQQGIDPLNWHVQPVQYLNHSTTENWLETPWNLLLSFEALVCLRLLAL